MKSLSVNKIKTMTVEDFNKLPASEQTELYINRQLPEPVMNYLFSFNNLDTVESDWDFVDLSEEDDYLFDEEEIRKFEEEYNLDYEGYIY